MALVLAVVTVSVVFALENDTLRIVAEERFEVGARVFEASANRGDYSPEFYRARFEATWRHLREMLDVTSPGVAVRCCRWWVPGGGGLGGVHEQMQTFWPASSLRRRCWCTGRCGFR